MQEMFIKDPFRRSPSTTVTIRSQVQIRLEARQKCEVFADDIENAMANAINNKQASFCALLANMSVSLQMTALPLAHNPHITVDFSLKS
jgi:hypothetical protein